MLSSSLRVDLLAVCCNLWFWLVNCRYDDCKEKLRFCICRDSIWQVSPAEIKQAGLGNEIIFTTQSNPPIHPPQFSSVSCVEQICLWFEHQCYSWCSFYQKNSSDNVISSCHWEKGWCCPLLDFYSISCWISSRDFRCSLHKSFLKTFLGQVEVGVNAVSVLKTVVGVFCLQ